MATAVMPQTRRFSKAEYHQMHDLGWFVDQYVELIDGEVIRMPVPGPEHCLSTDLTADALKPVFSVGYWVRAQMPLDLSMTSEPIPDVSVVRGDRRTFNT